MEKKYFVTAKSGTTREVLVNSGIEVEGLQTSVNLISLENNEFAVKVGDINYKAEVLDANYANKTFTILINNHKYKLQAENDFDLLLKRMGFDAGGSKKIKELKAPMPGMVLSILVPEGALVNKGDTLLVLEAMKMENSIKASGAAVVKQILATKGKAVEKGQVLVIFE